MTARSWVPGKQRRSPDIAHTRYGGREEEGCKAFFLWTSISLTDRHAAEIDAMIAGGDYASVSEVIRAALRQFMKLPPVRR
jgi:hypothetical protein